MQNLLRILGQTSYEQRRREFTVDGRRVSACVSQECWDALEDISLQEGVSLETLVAGVARRCGRRSLSLELDLFAISSRLRASISVRRKGEDMRGALGSAGGSAPFTREDSGGQWP